MPRLPRLPRTEATEPAGDLNRDPLLAPGPGNLADRLEHESEHRLVYDLETQAVKGHSLDRDRALMFEAAQLIRKLLGLTATDELLYPGKPSYPPTVNEPPIGHSLKDLHPDRQSDR